ncbi:MAG: hypothetical protein WCH65_05830 [bacterium]
MWKELIVVGLLGFVVRYLWKQKQLKSFFETFPLKDFVRVFLATILVTFLVSVFINGSGVGTWIMSIRYSMMGFLIFIVFFALSNLFFGAREINIVKRYSKIIKTLLVISIAWRAVLWLMPNALKFAGYNQWNYEGDVGIAPPAAYYTRYDQ